MSFVFICGILQREVEGKGLTFINHLLFAMHCAICFNKLSHLVISQSCKLCVTAPSYR